jgi:integrase
LKVLRTLGTIAIDEVTVADLRRLVEKLGATHAPSTVTQVISMLSALMRFALRAGYITHNPVRDLDRDDRPGVARRSEPRYLSSDKVALLLSKTGDTFRPVAATCAFAGLRISETLGLSWGDVDFEQKRINVRRQLDPDGTIRNATKTKSSTAFVPLLPALERELRAHRSRQSEIDLRLVKSSSLVFTTSRGEPQSRRNALRALHNAGDA